MSDSFISNWRFCPFWAIESKKCQVRNGGLFIPMDEHIAAYCTTLDYPHCLQYVMYARTQVADFNNTADTSENRRRYHRHRFTRKVTLVKLVESGEIVSHLSSVASTYDLSKGGMRLHLDKPLKDDTLIKFSFEDVFPEAIKHGTARVQWCNKQVDEQGYQAGIAFLDGQLIEKMGFYLELNM